MTSGKMEANGITTLSDADLQAQAGKHKAGAERCYARGRKWNRLAGEHRERLNEIGQEIMRRRVESVDKCGIISVNEYDKEGR